MKLTSLLLFGLILSFSCFSQKNSDLIFVPTGQLSIPDAPSPRIISVNSFWISNEITNKEFRLFYNQIINSPNDSMEWIDMPESKIGEMSKPKRVKTPYSSLRNKLMDEPTWKSVVEKGDYFTNPVYDNYPVVGVTWEGARFYCLWRSKEENKKAEGQKDALLLNYRLPTQYEWDYAMTFLDKASNENPQALHPIDQGDKNKIGIFNLNGNVAEWTSSSASTDKATPKVVKGFSWKSGTKEAQQLVLPGNARNDIGFRIVRSDSKN
jgi:formylglycine-generating enzyme required for sulfatase activity